MYTNTVEFIEDTTKNKSNAAAEIEQNPVATDNTSKGTDFMTELCSFV